MPSPPTAPGPQEVTSLPREDDFQKIADLIHDINRPDRDTFTRGAATSHGNSEGTSNSFDNAEKEGKSGRSAVRLALTALLLIVIAGGIIWLNPDLRISILNVLAPAVSCIEKAAGLHQERDRAIRPEKNIAFANVRESFHVNGWTVMCS